MYFNINFNIVRPFFSRRQAADGRKAPYSAFLAKQNNRHMTYFHLEFRLACFRRLSFCTPTARIEFSSQRKRLDFHPPLSPTPKKKRIALPM